MTHACRKTFLVVTFEHSLSTRKGLCSNPNLSLNFTKLCLQSALVKMSATCSSICMYSNRMVPFYTQSLRKWDRVSMCLLQPWNTGFLDSLMPLWLSQAWRVITLDCCCCFYCFLYICYIHCIYQKQEVLEKVATRKVFYHCMCPCMLEDIKQEAKCINVIFLSLGLGKYINSSNLILT